MQRQAKAYLVPLAQSLLAVEAAAQVCDADALSHYEQEVLLLTHAYAKRGGEVLRYAITVTDFINGYDADLLEPLLWIRFGENNPGLMRVETADAFCVWVSRRQVDEVRHWLNTGPWSTGFEVAVLKAPVIRRLSTPRKALRYLGKLKQH